MKSKILTISALSITLSCGVIASGVGSNKGIFSAFGSGSSTCHWNHYSEINPTDSSAGQREFYVCCDHHEYSFEEPTTGVTTNVSGAAAITTGHCAFLPKLTEQWSATDPTSLHEGLKYGYHTISVDDDIDCDEYKWISYSLSSNITIEGNNKTISNLTINGFYYEGSDDSEPGSGSNATYGCGFIANNSGTLVINDLTFDSCLSDMTNMRDGTEGSSQVGVVCGHNTGSLTLNDVNVANSSVTGYTKIGLLLGHQAAGTFMANHCALTNNTISLECDGSDNYPSFSATIVGYTTNDSILTNGIKLSGNTYTFPTDMADDNFDHLDPTETGTIGWYYGIVKGEGRYFWGYSPTYIKSGSVTNESTVFNYFYDGYGYETLSQLEDADGAVATVTGTSSSKGYGSLIEAINAEKTGSSTIKLVDDYTYPTTDDYKYGKFAEFDISDCTLDLNGKTVTVIPGGVVYTATSNEATIKNGTFAPNLEAITNKGYEYGLHVGGETMSNKVTVDDVVINGGINVFNSNVTVDSTNDETAITGGSASYAVWAEGNNSKVVIKNGTFTKGSGSYPILGTASEAKDKGQSGYEGEGFIIIEGGKFITGKDTPTANDLILSGSNVTIKGGYFDFDVETAGLLGDGYTVEKEGDLWKVVENVEHISTVSDLQGLATSVNAGTAEAGKKYVLDNDIDLDGITWTPIGTSTNPFNGIFDGNNHVISNLTVSTSSYGGLFGYVKGTENSHYSVYTDVWVNNALDETNIAESYYDCVIKNLEIKDSIITVAGKFAGAIGAAYYAYISNITLGNIDVECTNSGKYAGTLVGDVAGVCVKNVVNDANCSVTCSAGHSAGGIIGACNNTSFDSRIAVIDCINYAPVTTVGNGSGNTAGILGYGQGSAVKSLVLNNCKNYATITGNSEHMAGIIATAHERDMSVVSDCSNYGSIVANSGTKYLSGIVGQSGCIIYNCTNAGQLSGTASLGAAGVCAHGDSVTITSCYNLTTLDNVTCSVKNSVSVNGANGTTISGTFANVAALQEMIAGANGKVVLMNCTVADQSGTLTLPSSIKTLVSDKQYFAGLDISNCSSDYITVSIPNFDYTLYGDAYTKTLGLDGVNNKTTFASNCKLAWLRNYGSNGTYVKTSGCVVDLIHGATNVG